MEEPIELRKARLVARHSQLNSRAAVLVSLVGMLQEFSALSGEYREMLDLANRSEKPAKETETD